ncbi:MAG: S8 family peptidase [Candidatus Delongbacteria bacterium]|nr:S8 family peptidase [Candidatus Delongbacteria bacterium]
MHKLILFIFLFSGVTLASAQRQSIPAYHSDDIIMKLHDGYTVTDLMYDVSMTVKTDNISIDALYPHAQKPSREKNIDGQPLVDLTRYYNCHIQDGQQVDYWLNIINKSSATEYAEIRQKQDLLYVPDDPFNQAEQYYLDIIDAYAAYDVETGDTNVVIAITDTGIEPGHEDLVYSIAYNWDDPLDGIDNDNDGFVDNFRGWDIGDNDNNPQTDNDDHGIYVSGIAAADTDNGLGISGTGFDCHILPIKISDSDSLIVLGYEGIVHAANQGATIINCSWGNRQYSQYEQDMINYASINKNALVVAACGNDNDMRNFYPSSYNNVLSVAATTSEDEKWTPENTGTSGGSSYGYHVDLSAPGTMMYTTEAGNSYRDVYAGTSFASPVVSGVAGLVKSHFPSMTPNQIIERLNNTTDNIDTIPYNAEYAGLLGTGRVNAFKALTNDFQPGVQLRNIVISDDRENNYENSMLVEVAGDFYNYLSPAQNLQADISCNNPDVDLYTTTINIGVLDSLDSFSIASNPIQLEILSGASMNEHVILTLEMTDGDWHRTQYIEFYVMPSWKTLTNADMQLSIPANGRLGFSDLYRKHGQGFNFDITTDLFYDAGLMLGANADMLFDGIRQANRFSYDDFPEYMDYPDSKESIQSVFFAEDTENAVDLEIQQISIAPENSDNYIILKYDLINHNLSSLDDWHAGLFFDWDLIKPTRNRTVYDSIRNFGYTFHTGNYAFYCGIKLLSDYETCQYAIDQRSEADIVNVIDGFSDEEKFYSLSNNKCCAGIENAGSDVVQIVSAGNLNIPPEDTLTVCFAVMAGSSLLDIIHAADSAVSFYQHHIQESNVAQSTLSDVQIFPNPAGNNFILRLPDNITSGKMTIYGITGQVLLKQHLLGNKTKVDVNLPSGHYLLHVDTGSHLYKAPLIILNAD